MLILLSTSHNYTDMIVHDLVSCVVLTEVTKSFPFRGRWGVRCSKPLFSGPALWEGRVHLSLSLPYLSQLPIPDSWVDCGELSAPNGHRTEALLG